MSFFWICKASNKGWWANYRWHITESSEKLGLKSKGWEKVFFRSGWQGKVLEIENIEGAKKFLRALQNGTITAFGGRFRGASYDKNAERMIKWAKRSLKEAIKKHDKGETINVEETVATPPSYYKWWIIISIGGVVLIVLVIVLWLIWMRKSRRESPPF